MGQESPDMSDVKKCLEGAGLFEKRMEKSDMISYYNVIKSSEASASEESSRRRRRAPSEKSDEEPPVEAPPSAPCPKRPFTPKSSKRTTVKRPKQPAVDVTKSKPTAAVDRLSIVRHRPLLLGPFYAQREFRALPVDEKMRRISAQHLALAAEYHGQQRRSVHMAEWGPPVLASAKCDGRLERETETVRRAVRDEPEPDLFEEEPAEYTVTRGGRQVKRKIYTEMETDAPGSTKKTKPSQPKRSNAKKAPSNAEIIARSSLFAPDTPKTRSEILFENSLKEEAERSKEEEKERKFSDSLLCGSDDEFDIKVMSSQAGSVVEKSAEADEFQPDGSKFVKKRVVPPVAGRKGYRRNQALVPVDENVPTNSRRTKSPSPRLENLAVKSSQSGSKKPDPKCPICSRSFPQKEIEAHASTCGLTSELEIENNLPNKDGTQMLCNICDRAFPLSTDYEHHVAQCIKANSNK